MGYLKGISSKCLDLGDGANAYQNNLSFDVIIPQELCTPQMADVLSTMGYPQKSKSVTMFVDLDRFAIDQTASFDDETMIKA